MTTAATGQVTLSYAAEVAGEDIEEILDSVHPERQLCVSLLEVGHGWGGSLAGPTTDPLTKEARHVRCA
jgi:hypothetical protein